MNKGLNRAVLGFSLVVAVFFCFRVQKKIDALSSGDQSEKLLYLPSGTYLKPLVVGFDNLAADLLWIKAIGYFGSHYLTDKSYQWLYHILDLTTTLDPYFRYPYEFGGVILAIEREDVTQSNRLLKKGMLHHPDYWRFPFLVGFNTFFYLKNPEIAARYISRAAALPGRPAYLPKLAASLYMYTGQRETAIRFLNQMYESIEDSRLKENILQKIAEIEKGNLPKSLEQILAEKNEG